MPSFMHQALVEARNAATQNEVPVGAILVDSNGAVLARAHNLTERTSDPTAHAEILVIRAACQLRQSPRLPDCDLYVTLEPCPMCAQAISFARIRRLYFGAYDPKGGGIEQGARLFHQLTCHHRPEVYGGIAEQECGEVLKTFFSARRGNESQIASGHLY